MMQSEEKMSVFTCDVCGNYYNYRKSLRRHIYTAHPQQANNIIPVKNEKLLPYHCTLCDKSFKSKYNVQRHQRFIHGKMPQNRLKCMLCTFETINKKSWLDHLQSTHEIHLTSEDLQFSTEIEFFKWKEDLERRTHSKFISLRGTKLVGDGSRRYYVCHRSGRYISKSKGIRRPRLAGSCKINGKCPAEIKVLRKEGTYRVHFVSTHVGHNLLDQVSVNTYAKPPATFPDADDSCKGSESLSGVSAYSKTPNSLSDEQQVLISRFSDIVNGLTGSEIQLAKRMVVSLKERLCVLREQNSRISLFNSQKRSRKRKLAPKSREFSAKEITSSCQIPSVVTDTEETCDILGIFMDEGPNSIHSITVEEGSATPWQQELQCSITGPFIANADHDDSMPWKQELEQYEPGHISISTKQDDDTPWQQNLQNCTPGPASVAMEQNDDVAWHPELQLCTPGLDTKHYVDVEHSYAVPWHLIKQQNTPSKAQHCSVVCSQLLQD